LRVLQLTHEWPSPLCGGTGLYVAALVQALQQKNIVVKPLIGPASEPALRQAIAAFRPDSIHIHHLLGFPLKLPLLLDGFNVWMTLHDWWVGCARGQRLNRHFKSCSGPAPFKCAACTGPLYLAPWRARFFAERTLLLKAGLSRMSLLSPTRHLAKGLDLPAQILPLPLRCPVAPAPAAPPGPIRFLFLGSRIPTKGVHLAVQAFQKLPKGSSLSILGPVPEFAADYARSLPRIPGVYYGEVLPDRMDEVFASHDVLVFPSIWQENSPMVLMEAQAAGLPVVAFALDAVAELAPGASTVPIGDIKALSKAMLEEVAHGRRRIPVVSALSMDQHTDRLIRLYQGG
jgi:glycosyltransferase involved in cell wall biosynthesis